MTFLPATEATAGGAGNRKEIRHAVTYIANEFLENAMKYHQRDADIPIGIRLQLTSDNITVSASNGVGAEQMKRYKVFIEKLLAGDAGDMLLKQLEESSTAQESGASCLGLLTMINDYRARLGWLFEANTDDSETMTVTTSAVLPLSNFEGVSA